MQAAWSCKLGTVRPLHRNAQMCKTASVQAAVARQHVRAGGAGSHCWSTGAGRGGAAWHNCTCTDMDVQSSSNGDGAKPFSSGLSPPA